MGRLIEAFAQFLDDAGDPLINGWLKFLEPSSADTYKDTYSDENLSVVNENPLQLDASGRCPDVFGTGQYRVISFTENIEDEADVGEQIQMFDPVIVAGSTTGGGGGASFESWDDTTTYVLNDLVTYNTKYYRSLNVTSLDKNPAIETSYWEEIEFVSVWNTNVSYDIYEMVRYEDRIYFSLASLNSGNQPDVSPSDWGSPVLVGDDIFATNIDAATALTQNSIQVATISDTQTLTNKTIDADDNPISNLAHGAEVDNPSSGVHGATGTIVGTSDTQTLTNKTLTTPNINGEDCNADGAEIDKACDGIGVTIPRQKIVEIGTWDMDGDPAQSVAHGLDHTKIVGCRVIIRRDTAVGGTLYNLDYVGISGVSSGYFSITSVNVSMVRTAGEAFDSTNFNDVSGSYNRGFIILDYID
jgi:hypothetical protein